MEPSAAHARQDQVPPWHLNSHWAAVDTLSCFMGAVWHKACRHEARPFTIVLFRGRSYGYVMSLEDDTGFEPERQPKRLARTPPRRGEVAVIYTAESDSCAAAHE